MSDIKERSKIMTIPMIQPGGNIPDPSGHKVSKLDKDKAEYEKLKREESNGRLSKEKEARLAELKSRLERSGHLSRKQPSVFEQFKERELSAREYERMVQDEESKALFNKHFS